MSAGSPECARWASGAHHVRAVAALLLLAGACGEGTKPPSLASVSFTPDALALVTGDTVTAPATAKDSRGAIMPGTIMYRTDDAGVASVSASGRVVAEGVGTTIITATMGGESGHLRVSVVQPTVRTVTMAIDTATLTVAASQAVRVSVTDTRGRTVVVPLRYEASDAAIATVDDTGTVTVHRVGSATITVRADTARAEFRVKAVPQFVAMATGELHTCGISGTGRTYCWGAHALGTLDQQACSAIGAPCSATPVEIYGGLRLRAITAGGSHACGLDQAGAAWCWGNNHHGQVGSRIGVRAPIPVGVTGNLQFSSISAGRTHTCGLTPSGEAWCWGRDQAGQLGAGIVAPERCEYAGAPEPCSMVPIRVAGGLTFAELVASETVTCARTPEGRIYCWGLEVGGTEQAECHGGAVARCTRTPLLQIGGEIVGSLLAGSMHRCGQAASGTLECWGANLHGAFGDGTTMNSSDTPVPAAGEMAFRSVVSSSLSMCGLTDAGVALCWGHNASGTIGNASTSAVVPSPSPVAGGIVFDSLWSGSSGATMCGVARTGRAHCWGFGIAGQLGNISFSSSNVPVSVAGLR